MNNYTLLNKSINQIMVQKCLVPFQLIPYKSSSIGELIEKVISEVARKNEEKLNFKKRTENNLYKEKGIAIERKFNDFFYGKRATLSDIFTHYQDHRKLKTKGDDSIENVMGSMGVKFLTNISKYTNDLVEKGKLLSNITYHKPSSKLNSTNTVVSKIDKKNLTNKNNTRTSLLKSGQADSIIKNPISTRSTDLNQKDSLHQKARDEMTIDPDDSYVSVKEEKHDQMNKKKERNFFGYDKKSGEENHKMYMRINDLNKLEFEYFIKNKSKNANNAGNQDFSEIYYNFKKKL
jgi:hypothetical protein